MGVGLHNVWVRPDVHVLADAAADHANMLRRATLRVDGLLCSLGMLNVRRPWQGIRGSVDRHHTGEGDQRSSMSR